MAKDLRSRALAFADLLASTCASALGTQAVAAFLHGSLTLDDFTPGRSDVDLLLIVERPLAGAESSALLRAVDQLREAAPWRVDLRVVTRAVAAVPTPAPAMDLYVALRPGQQPEVEWRVAGEPDLAVEFSMVRARGRSIFGPDPRTVIGAVPDSWVVAIGDRYLAAWEQLVDDAAHAELMALTSCRVWRFAVEGVHCSKTAAGRWALACDPSLTAVEQALRQRGGDPTATIDPGGIGRLIAIVRREIANRQPA
jgi:hypothetical protein